MAELDPFGGFWLWASEFIEFDVLMQKYNQDFDSEDDKPIPYSLATLA